MNSTIPQTKGFCPHCNKKISGYVDNKYMYGSPVKTCKKCNGVYLDPNYHEIAIDGFPSGELSIKRGIKSALMGAGIFLVCAIIFVCELLFSERVHIYPPILAIGGIFIIITSIVDIIKIKSGAKTNEMERLRAESILRLKNPLYAQQLRDIGYNVPAEFLPQPINDAVQAVQGQSEQSFPE